jgi:hypothetical protein
MRQLEQRKKKRLRGSEPELTRAEEKALMAKLQAQIDIVRQDYANRHEIRAKSEASSMEEGNGGPEINIIGASRRASVDSLEEN